MTRVVITKVGIISSLGNNLSEVSSNIKDGLIPPIKTFEELNVPIIPLLDFNPRSYVGRNKDLKYLSRGNQLAVSAAFQITKTLSEEVRHRLNLYLGAGPNFDFDNIFNDGKIDYDQIQALWILNFLPNTASSFISKLANIHGESYTIGTACAASLQSIGLAYEKIRDDQIDMALAGGGDSRISRGGLKSYQRCNALFDNSLANATTDYAPFSDKRYGLISGEGASFFLLESLKSAKNRNANILAEVIGHGCSTDGYNMTAPNPSGDHAVAAIKKAMKTMNLSPKDIDVVSTHGTGTPLNDEMESIVLSRVFEGCDPDILSIKSWIGHLAAACGAMELAIVLACMKNKTLPMIRNLENKNKINNLNYITENIKKSFDTVLLQNFGFGGQNSALIVKKWK